MTAMRRSSQLGNWSYLSLHHGWEGDGYRIELRWKGQVIYGEDQRGFLFNAGCENTATTFCNWTSTASTGASLLGAWSAQRTTDKGMGTLPGSAGRCCIHAGEAFSTGFS